MNGEAHWCILGAVKGTRRQLPTLLITAIVSGLLASATHSADSPVDPESEEVWHSDEPLPINWVDSSHAYATNQAQSLTMWMDDFFGDPDYTLEQAESWARLELEDDWDQEDGHDGGLRLRGKVLLPKISTRVALVFAGEESESGDPADREFEDRVGLQLNVLDSDRSRFDATLSVGSGKLKPGVKYRNEGAIDKVYSYRYVHRLQYEDGEGFFTIPDLDLNRVISDYSVMRWSNRFAWGERTDGVEWRSRVSMRQRIFPNSEKPVAMNYFLSLNGVTRPDSYVKNYRLGFLWRRNVYRDFLFVELEPAYNLRRRLYEDERDGVWSMAVRLEISLERDLARSFSSD
jgi:hypothetical protein